MMEIWKDINGYEGLYQVSNLGRVKSLERYKQNHSKLQLIPEKIKSKRIDAQGYELVDLYNKSKQKTIRVHRLVAETFISNYGNEDTVNHKDGNKTNNKVVNLEWASFEEQNKHFYKHNLKSEENIKKAVKAMNKAQSKPVKCLNNGKVYESASEAAREIGVSGSLVMRCCRGEGKSAGKDKDNNPLHWVYI